MNHLTEFIIQDSPKINPLIGDGLAKSHLDQVEEYLYNKIKYLFRESERNDFPVRFKGISRLTPEEEQRESEKRTDKNKKNIAEQAPSSLVMRRLEFEFIEDDGEIKPMNFNLSIPYVDENSGIKLSGAQFYIIPVLADKVISVESSSIFIKLVSDRFNIRTLQHFVVMDGLRISDRIHHAKIYHKSAAQRRLRRSVNARITLPHYLFSKNGVTKTFNLIGVDDIHFGSRKEINKTTFNPEKYHIFSTAFTEVERRPKGTRRDRYWEPTDLAVAINKDQYNALVQKILVSLFYVADHFPQKFKIEYIDNVRMWKVLMGLILFSENVNEGKLYSDVKDHFVSLDQYIDPYTAKKLKESNKVAKEVNDIYELFIILMGSIDTWLMNSLDEMTTMYDKEYNVLDYLLAPIIKKINMARYQLVSSARRTLTYNRAKRILQQQIRPGLIYGIRSGHGEVRTETASGDNKLLTITGKSVHQEKADTTRRTKRRDSTTDVSRKLHSSIAAIGGYLTFTKSESDGRSNINPHQELINGTDTVKPKKFAALLDEIQELIRL